MKYEDILNKVLILSLSEAKDKGFSKENLENQGKKLFEDFLQNGYIRQTPSEMLSIPMYAFAYFLKLMYEKKGNVSSPVANEKDGNWLSEKSIAFVNVRATGSKDQTHGDFITSTRVIPTLRVDGIHLSPFFDHAFNILYAIDCLWVISDDFINKFYSSLIPAKEQIKFFIDTAHLLGKVVGFDLEYHTSQFSRIALEYPEFYRWIKLQRYEDGTVRLADNLTQREQLSKEYQSKIHSEVREVVKSVLKKNNLKSFGKGNVLSIRTAHLEAIQMLIEKGLWTIPTHTWNGVGLPEFSHYVEDRKYPEFRYINAKGEDHRGHAFGLLSPFKFYDNLPINSIPTPENIPQLDRKVLNFFAKIPINIIRRYGFDFIRWDYTDHVFDSILNGDYNIPISDRITPYIIKYVIRKVRKKYPYIGMFFERMGDDFVNYYKVGADLILGGDIWYDMSKDYIKQVLKLSIKLHKFNTKRERKINVCYAVDTHDTENPVINRNPLVRGGDKELLLRFFLSRFASAGKGHRPKYECIGTNEGTIGLFKANIAPITLEWKNNKYVNETYHNIEDTYEEFKKIITSGEIKLIRSKRNIVFWKITSNEKSFYCIVNLSSRKVRFRAPEKLSYIIKPYTRDRAQYDNFVEIASFEPVIGVVAT